ncbi:MAG: hypothetical protein RIR92_820, partial [Pseudomonadota bacterium]
LGCCCCKERCSRHAGSVAAHCSKAAMFASARPPCRQSTRAVSCRQSSHKNNWYLTPITTPKLHLHQQHLDRPSVRGCFCQRKRSKKHTGADGHANDYLPHKQPKQPKQPKQHKQHARPSQETTRTFATIAPPPTPQSPRAICCQSPKCQSAS